jgi:hypothetical protein
VVHFSSQGINYDLSKPIIVIPFSFVYNLFRTYTRSPDLTNGMDVEVLLGIIPSPLLPFLMNNRKMQRAFSFLLEILNPLNDLYTS